MKNLRYLAILLLLLPLAHKAEAQQVVFNCILATSTPCNSTSNPGNGTQGIPIWQMGGYQNTMNGQIYNMFGTAGTWKSSGVVSYLDILNPFTGTKDSSHCPSGAGTMVACVGGSSAWASLTSGTNTTGAFLVGAGSSLAPTSTGVISANEVNGAVEPVSAPFVGTNSSGQHVAVTPSAAATADLLASTALTVAGTGCTPTISSSNAGPFSALVAMATGPCTAITITLNGATGFTAPHGFSCTANDRTQLNAGVFIPAWGPKSTTTTTATFPIPAAVATTDVLDINCGYN